MTWYLREAGSTEDTDFFDEFQWKKKAPLFGKDGAVSIDEVSEIRELIWRQHKQDIPTAKIVLNWFTTQPIFTEREGVSNQVFFEYSNTMRQHPSDIKMRMTNDSWRYFAEGILRTGDYVPAGKVGVVFSAYATNSSTVNGRSFIHIKGEAAKGTMAFLFDTAQEAAAFYKYSRTKFFFTLVDSRIAGHNARAQAYQDIPMFSFTETDPIDWSLSIPEIDNQLIAHFGLEDYREYILSASKPYARALAQEYLDRLTEANVDVSGINEWY